jgi:hypothetical protein
MDADGRRISARITTLCTGPPLLALPSREASQHLQETKVFVAMLPFMLAGLVDHRRLEIGA